VEVSNPNAKNPLNRIQIYTLVLDPHELCRMSLGFVVGPSSEAHPTLDPCLLCRACFYFLVLVLITQFYILSSFLYVVMLLFLIQLPPIHVFDKN